MSRRRNAAAGLLLLTAVSVVGLGLRRQRFVDYASGEVEGRIAVFGVTLARWEVPSVVGQLELAAGQTALEGEHDWRIACSIPLWTDSGPNYEAGGVAAELERFGSVAERLPPEVGAAWKVRILRELAKGDPNNVTQIVDSALQAAAETQP